MEWLNLHVSALDSAAFLGADPICRATWLCLMRYAIGQETGGRIVGCKAWGDRKWQQMCRVMLAEVERACPLWKWIGDDLFVAFYPSDKEAIVRAKRVHCAAGGESRSPRKIEAARENGRLGGRPRKPNETERKEPNETQSETQGITQIPPSVILGGGRETQQTAFKTHNTRNKPNGTQPNPTEGKGREGKGRERARAGGSGNPALGGGLPASAAAERDDREREAETIRQATIARQTPAMLDRARRMLAVIDANPAIAERLDQKETQRLGLLRTATAAGKPTIYAESLARVIPELAEIKLELPPC